MPRLLLERAAIEIDPAGLAAAVRVGVEGLDGVIDLLEEVSQPQFRILTRTEACAVIGVCPDRLLDGPEWDAGELARCRSAVLAGSGDPVREHPPSVVAVDPSASPAAEHRRTRASGAR